MPVNTLAPGYVVGTYTVTIATIPYVHTFTLGVKPVDWAAATPTIQRQNAAAVAWTTAIDEYINLVKAIYHNAFNFVSANLMRQDTPDSVPIYVATGGTPAAGTGAGAPTPYLQEVFSFRTYDGGNLFVKWMETGQAANLRDVYAGMGAPRQAFVDYVKGATSWLYARDNSFPKQSLWRTTKTNDATRKMRQNL